MPPARTSVPAHCSPDAVKLIQTKDDQWRPAPDANFLLNAGHWLARSFTPPAELSRCTPTAMTTPLTDKLVRDWYFEGVVMDVYEETIVSNMGSGPFIEEDFDNFLYRLGVSVYVNGPETEVIIVGREEWREDDPNDLLERRAGNAEGLLTGDDDGLPRERTGSLR